MDTTFRLTHFRMLGSLKKSLATFMPESLLAGFRSRRLRGCVVSLMYHEVLPDTAPIEAWTVVTESNFRRQMRYLRDHFEILTLDQAIDRFTSGEENIGPAAVITFDDGYWGNRHVVWPVVNDLKIPITVFVATAAVQDQQAYWYDRVIAAVSTDRTISLDLRDQGLDYYRIDGWRTGERRWNQVQRLLSACKRLTPERRATVVERLVQDAQSQATALRSMEIKDIQSMAESDRVCFGAHSHCHSILTQLDREEVRQSVLHSKSLLEKWTGKPVRHFAYPNGDFNAMVTEVVRECGFVSSQATIPGYWDCAHSMYAIPRIGVGRYDRFGWFRARVSGL